MNSNIPTSILAGTLILITAALSEPSLEAETTTAEERRVRALLQLEVVARVDSQMIRFSRAAPSRSRRHELELDPRQFVGTEARWPFRVLTRSVNAEGKPTVKFEGYLRISDDEVFVKDQFSKRYVTVSEHPFLKLVGRQLPPKPHEETPKAVAEKPL
ncbi:MAG: hypothetical protein AAGI48_15860 [Verrucomicrobiota bacterium]